MAATGRGWPTDDMTKFMEARKEGYITCKAKKSYRSFFNQFNAEWCVEFPMVEELFPGRKFEGLSDDEKSQHANAWRKRQEQIKEWFRWRYNPRKRAGGNGTDNLSKVEKAMLNLIYEKERKKKPYEKYAELFPESVYSDYQAACTKEDKTGKERLPVWTRVAKQKWKKATPEERTAVEEALGGDVKENLWAENPEQIQKFVDAVPTILAAALGPLARKTGLAFFVTYIGPFPGAGGAVKMRTIQHGEHDDAPVLGEVCPDYEQMMLDKVAPYYNLHVRQPGDRTADFSTRTKGGGEASKVKPTNKPLASSSGFNAGAAASSRNVEGSGTENISPAPGAAGATVGGAAGATVTAPSINVPQQPAPVNVPQQPAPVNVPQQPTQQPAQVNVLQQTTQAPVSAPVPQQTTPPVPPFIMTQQQAPAPVSQQSTPPVPPLIITHQQALAPSPDPVNILQETSQAQAPASPPQQSDVPLQQAVSAAVNDLQQTTQQQVWSPIDNLVPQQSASAPVIGLAPQQTVQESISAPLNGNQQHTNTIFDNIDWSVLSDTVNAAGVDCFDPDIVLAMDQLIGPNFDTDKALDNLNSQLSNPFPEDPAADDDRPRLPGYDQIPDEQDDQEELSNHAIRRSGRAPAPSTRLEKQNLIGTNTVLHPVAVEKKSAEDSKIWFDEASSWLKGRGLGSLFDEVVESWEKLEETMAYGLVAKGSIPMANLRPAEWRNWTSKGRMGRRLYEQVPIIAPAGAAEFGLTVLKWWCAIQPAFRQNAQGPIPLPTYATPGSSDDVWAPLRKGGPNGLVSVVTLLSWWGLAAQTVPEFEKDSRSEWKAMVVDVTRAFKEMTATAGFLKRPADADSGSCKRPRTV
ncbi:hypothetical protein EST38_g10271 [Candolleomyces aberdarensis]|uniref:Uncharacterized protein n=1 Tax=Candolleomyces aberdarensis TaxID=2316362 RepID=A0A4V1Q2M2_9AGAR|nr:hypothetical protein EST38_g10271 [Candolleomyces aberdarensis]